MSDDPRNDRDDEIESNTSSGSDSEPDSEDLEGVTPRRPMAPTSQRQATTSLPKYRAPPGMHPITVSSAYTSMFEYNALAAKPGVELWAIRVPKDIKPSKLKSLRIERDFSGKLDTKSGSFKLLQAGSSKAKTATVNAEGRQPNAGPGMVDAMLDEDELKGDGGDEMTGLRLLVPDVEKSGKLVAAPIPVSKRFVLATSVEEPVEADLPSFLSTSDTVNIPAPPPKRVQPTHLFKFRNRAYGFDTGGPDKRRKV